MTEQDRIVSILEDLQAKIDVLTRCQEETSNQLDTLLASLLDRAFRGEV